MALSLYAAQDQGTAREAPPAQSRFTLEYEMDPYYLPLDLYINLTGKPIENAGEKEELDIYRELFLSSYVPSFIVLEASIAPLPLTGVYLKKRARGTYGSALLVDNVNLVKAVTAGFDEPYSLSLFLGNVVNFTKPGEREKMGNKGYMGYLISVSDRHIKNNELVEDNNAEIEWKIKGDRVYSTHDLHWSFRAGVKLHDNPNITDTVYLAFRRSRVDFEADAWSIVKNSGFEFRYDVDSETMQPIRLFFVVDKKWPVKREKFALSAGLGFIWESKRRYTGSLADERHQNFTLILRPNIVF